jgi:hypothetical protein
VSASFKIPTICVSVNRDFFMPNLLAVPPHSGRKLQHPRVYIFEMTACQAEGRAAGRPAHRFRWPEPTCGTPGVSYSITDASQCTTAYRYRERRRNTAAGRPTQDRNIGLRLCSPLDCRSRQSPASPRRTTTPRYRQRARDTRQAAQY